MFIIMIGFATELPKNLCMTALLYRVMTRVEEATTCPVSASRKSSGPNGRT